MECITIRIRIYVFFRLQGDKLFTVKAMVNHNSDK